jgi:hypothetical protein
MAFTVEHQRVAWVVTVSETIKRMDMASEPLEDQRLHPGVRQSMGLC